jgi:hypothetical protein
MTDWRDNWNKIGEKLTTTAIGHDIASPSVEVGITRINRVYATPLDLTEHLAQRACSEVFFLLYLSLQ